MQKKKHDLTLSFQQENICVILFNAHYPISLRSKEKELIRMFEIVLGRGK
jgi:hypothetical protein